MTSPITIVVVRALGLSGATWFNLVLGGHTEAMSMGPPARILDLPASDADHACFVHRERCDLWPAFLREGDHRGTFFADLAAYTGKRVFIVNYPPKALLEREIAGKGHRVLTIRLQRDGRATLHSHMRHYGTLKPGTGVHHILTWQMPIWDRVDRKMPQDTELSLVVRHEDMVTEPKAQLDRIGSFIGIRYAEDATRFWERSQHMTSGNTGVVDLVCRLQGEEGWSHGRSEAYAEVAKKLKGNVEEAYLDRSWIDGLSHEDKLAFDCLMGERNARYGYPRDEFSSADRQAFWKDLYGLIDKAKSIEADPTVPARAAGGQTQSRFPGGGWLRKLIHGTMQIPS